MTKKILDSLGLGQTNPGTWLGSESSEDAAAPLMPRIGSEIENRRVSSK